MNKAVATAVAALMMTTLTGTSNSADLHGAAGKLFDVDLEKRQCRFLKQDVPPGTDVRSSEPWHTISWKDSVDLLKHETRPNFSGISGPVIALFSGLDDEAAAALKKGESFRADQVILRPDLKESAGISDDGTSVSAWFTPRQARYSRDGKIKLGDQVIDAGVKRGGTRITIHEELTEGDLTNGFWKATLSGAEKRGGFEVVSMRLEPLVNPFEVDDPKLPRVLSVGDSICMNYEKSTRENLKGIANYHRIEDNCWSTFRGMSFIHYWLGDYERKGLGWDVILFNSGMHDMKQKVLGGDYAVPLDVYRANLRKEIEIMKKTGAVLVWVATTPVPNDCGSANYAFRSKGAEEDFNRAALEVLKDYPEIQVCDLARVVHESDVMDEWRKGKDVHYWHTPQQDVLGEAVAEAVKEALKARDR